MPAEFLPCFSCAFVLFSCCALRDSLVSLQDLSRECVLFLKDLLWKRCFRAVFWCAKRSHVSNGQNGCKGSAQLWETLDEGISHFKFVMRIYKSRWQQTDYSCTNTRGAELGLGFINKKCAFWQGTDASALPASLCQTRKELPWLRSRQFGRVSVLRSSSGWKSFAKMMTAVSVAHVTLSVGITSFHRQPLCLMQLAWPARDQNRVSLKSLNLEM